MMTEKYFITIGRQFGSRGYAIGKSLAQKLGIGFYDKELINMASRKSGLGKELFENADEKTSHSLLGGLLGLRNSMCDETYLSNYLSNETLFKIQSEVIRDVSKKQSAVFVGRCADYVLKDDPNVLNVFVLADMAERVKNVSQDFQLSEKESLLLIQKTDKQRAAYYDYYTSKEWGKASSYHMCINTSFAGFQQTIDLIGEAAEKAFLKL